MHDYLKFIRKLTLLRIYNLCLLGFNFISLILFRKEIFKSLPFSLTIELTNKCNLKCPQCLTGLNMYPGNTGMMSLDFFKQLIDVYYQKIIMVQLHFRGESMMHKDIFEMIQYAASKNIYTSLSTNGHFLVEHIENLLMSGINHLNISLDGLTNDVYIKYRKGGDLNLVMNGIHKLTTIKTSKKLNRPRVTLQMLVSKHNKNQINDFLKLKKIPGIDACLLKTMQIIDPVNQEEFIPEGFKFKRKIKKSSRKICLKTLTTVVFTWDGKILPCCYDRAEEFVLNDNEILTQNLLSRVLYDFRRKWYANAQKPEMCINCEESSNNIFL